MLYWSLSNCTKLHFSRLVHLLEWLLFCAFWLLIFSFTICCGGSAINSYVSQFVLCKLLFFPCLITHISQYTLWTLLTPSDITFRKSHLDFSDLFCCCEKPCETNLQSLLKKIIQNMNMLHLKGEIPTVQSASLSKWVKKAFLRYSIYIYIYTQHMQV